MVKFSLRSGFVLASLVSGVVACSASVEPQAPQPSPAQAQSGVPGLSDDPIQSILDGKPDAFTLRAVSRAESRLTSEQKAYLDSLDWAGGTIEAAAFITDPVVRTIVAVVLDELAASASIRSQSLFGERMLLRPLNDEAPADPAVVEGAVKTGLAKMALGLAIGGGVLLAKTVSGAAITIGVVLGAALIITGLADTVNSTVLGLLTKALQSVLASAPAAGCVADRVAKSKECVQAGLVFDGCRSCVKGPSTAPDAGPTDAGPTDAGPTPTSCTAPSIGPCAGCSIGGCIAPLLAMCMTGVVDPGAGGDGGEGGAQMPPSCAKPASCVCGMK